MEAHPPHIRPEPAFSAGTGRLLPNGTDSCPAVEHRLLSTLLPGNPIRTKERRDHVRVLAEILDDCPPIVIRPDGHIIDGHHRVAAARLIGRQMIAVVVHDVDDETAFTEAIQLNSSHGLPLSRADRRALVERLVTAYPSRSDRSIATMCGVAPGTVAAQRAQMSSPPDSECSGAQDEHLNSRTGRDGKEYPVSSDPEHNLDAARAVLAETPDITTRELATAIGVAVGTAHNLRTTIKRETSMESASPRIEEPARQNLLARAVRRLVRWCRWIAGRGWRPNP